MRKFKKIDAIFIIAITGVSSVFIFSTVSYPSSILPIKINFMFYLALLSNCSSMHKLFLAKKKYLRAAKIVLVLIALMIPGAFNFLHRLTYAYHVWKIGNIYYTRKDYKYAIACYESLLDVFQNNGEFQLQFGKALFYNKDYHRSISALKSAEQYRSNDLVQITLGDSYKALNMIDAAEIAYYQASYMVPVKFYPKYQLAMLYNDTKSHNKAKAIAREILHKDIKIESSTVTQMKLDMLKIISSN